MGTQHRQGFTIIEVLLFLSITGLLAVTLLGGWTTMINTQRYRDSIKTVQAFIQQQYGLVYNVQNSRDSTLGCTIGIDGPEVDSTLPDNPGQTGCIVMGRYVHITGGSNVSVYSIIGEDGESGGSLSDNAIIVARKPKILDQSLTITDSELNVPWQARVVNPGTTTTRNVGIAIIRSPQTGSVHTYSRVLANTNKPPLFGTGGLVAAANENVTTNLCLDAGTPLSGGRMGVVIRPYASSQSFIQTIADNGTC